MVRGIKLKKFEYILSIIRVISARVAVRSFVVCHSAKSNNQSIFSNLFTTVLMPLQIKQYVYLYCKEKYGTANTVAKSTY